MDNWIFSLWFLALLSPFCAAPVSEIFTVSVRSSVSVRRGHSATLPCWLSPSLSAEDKEVRWYQEDQYDTPVLLYKTQAFEPTSQKALYAGRVSFGLKEETSGGLKTGDVSLKLENVTITDEGKYSCYVSSLTDEDSADVNLTVTETGNPPLLSAVIKEKNQVNVSCKSEGWYPKPELRWSDGKKAVTSDGVSFGKNSAGLYSVHSWLLLPTLSEVSCSVGLSGDEPKEATVRMNISPLIQDGSSAGWVAFGILLAAVVAAFGALYFLYFKKKANRYKSGHDTADGRRTDGDPMISIDEKEPLLSTVASQSKALLEASKHYENVQLVDSGNEFVKIKGSILRDARVEFPDGDRVNCLTAVRGSPGFSSGQHYWEVSLAMANIDPKKSWWIGVTDKEMPSDNNLPPTSKNGFWFLSSCPEQEHSVLFSTEPEVSFPIKSSPKTIGVYLDFNNKELSFYNVEDKCLIGSMVAESTEKLFPLFNPGKGDSSSMKVLQRPVQDQANNTSSVCMQDILRCPA